jgi:CheY-like chemotaxis protein
MTNAGSPVPNDLAGETPSAGGNASPASGAGSVTILVVDNEAVVRNLAKTVLERHGYVVLVAADGREAVETYRHQGGRIAVVLLDWIMPVLSGADTLTELRHLSPEVRVVLTSGGLLEPGTVPPAVGAFGAQTLPPIFLPKPYRTADLLAAVAAALPGGNRV